MGLRDVKEGYQLYIVGLAAAVHGCVCDGVQSEWRCKLNDVSVQSIWIDLEHWGRCGRWFELYDAKKNVWGVPRRIYSSH